MKTATKGKIIILGMAICILLASCKSDMPAETIPDTQSATEQTAMLEDNPVATELTVPETSAEENKEAAEAEMLFQCDVEAVRDMTVPDISLTAEPLALIPQDSGYKWIGDEYAASVPIREVGHEPVTLSAEDARIYASNWIREHCVDFPENMISTEDMEVTPITMGAGNADGHIAAYNVFKAHYYQGIPVLGDHYNMIVDDGGEIYISLQWSEYKEVAICTSNSGSTPVDFDTAAQLVRQYLSKPGGYQSPNAEELTDIQVKQVELVYCFNESSGMYQPNWRFSIEGYCYVLVNCVDGEITEM